MTKFSLPDLENCDAVIPKTVNENTILPIYADEGFVFGLVEAQGSGITNFWAEMTPETYPNQFNDDATVFYGKFNEIPYIDHEIDGENNWGVVFSSTFNFSMWAYAEEGGEPSLPDLRYRQDQLERATSDYSEDVITTETVVVYTTEEGFLFTELGLYFSGVVGVEHVFYPDDDDDRGVVFSEDLTTVSVDFGNSFFNEIWESAGGTISAVSVWNEFKEFVEVPEIPEFATSFINIYKMSLGTLDAISGQRLPEGSENIDLGAFMYKLYTLPLPIPEGIISDNKVNIKLGWRETTIQANYYKSNRLLYDLGIIKVPEIYNNVFDYKLTSCFLHVPYLEPIEIPVDYVINSTIGLTYAVDLYNGFTSLNITTDKIDGVFMRSEVDLTREIPVMRRTENTISGTLGNYIYNDIETPYIEVRRAKPYSDTNTRLGLPSHEYGQIGAYLGYVEVEDAEIFSLATDLESKEINQLLKQGVYIND